MGLSATVRLPLALMPSITALTVAITASINQVVPSFVHANQMENGMEQYLVVIAVSDMYNNYYDYCLHLFLYIGHMSATISSQSEIGLITGFTACLLLLLGLIITLIIIAVILLKIKVKLTLELKKERDKNILYNVIDVNSVGLTQIPDPPVARVNTAVNIAYTHVTQ